MRAHSVEALVHVGHRPIATSVIVGRTEKTREAAATSGTADRPVRAVLGDLNDATSLTETFAQVRLLHVNGKSQIEIAFDPPRY